MNPDIIFLGVLIVVIAIVCGIIFQNVALIPIIGLLVCFLPSRWKGE
jgi:hypothetical protein